MIVIGSYALALLDHQPFDTVKDLDLIGVEDDVERFRALNQDIIERDRPEHGHRHVFHLKAGQAVDRVEIEFEQSPSDQMLPALCERQATIMGLSVRVPPVEVLYLTKRSHANVPVHYNKTMRDILRIKSLIGPITDAQTEFYKARKQEVQDRYSLHRQRFSLAIRNEDFFDTSNHIRFYEHDDLHEAVAHDPGQPLYKKCKYDLSLAKIDIDLFEKLSPQDRLRMVQEEFMVIGIERYYLHNRKLNLRQVYDLGMHKTIRDLFVGYFQNFCIDHVDELITPPPFDFIARFTEAERTGRVRQVEIRVTPPNDTHKKVWGLIQKRQLNDARRISEDLIRRSDHGIDSHAAFLLGATLFESRQQKNAEVYLRRCLSRDRNHAMAWFYLGAALRQMNRPDQAVDALKRAASNGFKSFALFWNLGLAYEKQSMNKQAIAAYRRAYTFKKDDPRLAQRLKVLGAPVS